MPQILLHLTPCIVGIDGGFSVFYGDPGSFLTVIDVFDDVGNIE
jgi:hypothetical protein